MIQRNILNREAILHLIQLLPADVDREHVPTSLIRQVEGSNLPLRWVHDPAFGWHYALLFAKRHLPLPDEVKLLFTWIYRAYELEAGLKYYGRECLPVNTAIDWAVSENRSDDLCIRAMLVSPDATYAAMNNLTNIPIKAAQAFVQLFFNFYDRRHDEPLLIARLVYLEGYAEAALENPQADPFRPRNVEAVARRMAYGEPSRMVQEYFENTQPELLALRAGYRNGMRDALYSLGHRHMLISPSQDGEDKERFLVTNASFHARNTWILQRPRVANRPQCARGATNPEPRPARSCPREPSQATSTVNPALRLCALRMVDPNLRTRYLKSLPQCKRREIQNHLAEEA